MSDTEFSDVIDFSEVEVSDFSPIPNGTYSFTVESYKVDSFENKSGNPKAKIKLGTPSLNFMFSCTEDPYVNRKVFANIYIAPSTLGFLKALMEASGEFTEEELNGPLKWREAAERMVGCELALKLNIQKSEKYGDKNRIQSYIHLDNYTPDDDDDYEV